jgi:hypothetical protein
MLMEDSFQGLITSPPSESATPGPSQLDEHRFDEYRGDLRAHHARGVRFLFLLVGVPGRSLASVAVDLG